MSQETRVTIVTPEKGRILNESNESSDYSGKTNESSDSRKSKIVTRTVKDRKRNSRVFNSDYETDSGEPKRNQKGQKRKSSDSGSVGKQKKPKNNKREKFPSERYLDSSDNSLDEITSQVVETTDLTSDVNSTNEVTPQSKLSEDSPQAGCSTQSTNPTMADKTAAVDKVFQDADMFEQVLKRCAPMLAKVFRDEN